MEIIGIIIVAIFVNNIVFSQFLGICPFLGVSKKIDTAIGMSAAVTFVITLSTLVTYLIQKGILENFGLEYLQTITFILVIASLVQMVEIIIKKISPPLYQALGVYLPLITPTASSWAWPYWSSRKISIWWNRLCMPSPRQSVIRWPYSFFRVSANSWRSPKYQKPCKAFPLPYSQPAFWQWPLWVSPASIRFSNKFFHNPYIHFKMLQENNLQHFFISILTVFR